MASPVIREYQQQTQPGLASGGPYANPVDTSSASGFGSAAIYDEVAGNLHRAAVSFRERDEADARAWASNTAAKARLDWTTDFINRQERALPGAPGFTPTLIEDFDKYSEKTIEAAPTDMAKNYTRDRLNAMRGSLTEKAMVFEAQARIDHRTDQYKSAVDNSAKLMNTDPSQFDEVMAERIAEIDGSSLPPVKKSALRDHVINTIAAAATWSQIQKSPTTFLQSIGFEGAGGKTRKSSGDLMGVTGNKAFDILPFDKRVQMFEGAVRLKAQIDIDADKAIKAKAELDGDNALKEGWSRLYNGKLTRAYIEEIRPVLKPSEYHSLLEASKKGAGGSKTDPGTFRQLQELLYTDPAEAEKFAFKAHRNGNLSNEHLSSSLSRARELSRSEGPKSEYERSRNYIRGSLDPGPMVNDPVSRSRMAEALDTFDRWVDAGKGKRSDEEVAKRGREVVDQYKFIDLSETVLALPSPRSGKIRRNSQDRAGIQQDILAAGRKAKAEYDAGKMSDADYQLEMQTLDRWRRAIK